MITLLFTGKFTLEELEELTLFFWENRNMNPYILMAEA